MSRIHDVAVLGGGVLGNFAAYYLARAGLDTCLVERGYTASGTSAATHAWVFISTKTPNFYGRFSYDSSLLYEALEREHGVDFQYERSGGLSILWNDAALEKAKRMIPEQNAAGVECYLLTPEEAAAREPIISPQNIKGAIYGPLDGCVNPFSVMYAMNRLAREFGVTFRPYSEVTGVRRVAHGFTVTTASGEIEARKILVTAGVWSRQLSDIIGFRLPVEPSRGQVLVSEPMPPTVHHIVANGSIRQLIERGIILMGRVIEHGATDNSNTYEGIQSALRDVLHLSPAMGKVRIVRSYAGIRPQPFDDLPVMGEVPGQPGVFTAVTHSGITLGPIIGLSMSQLITGKRPTYDLTPYLWNRVAKEA